MPPRAGTTQPWWSLGQLFFTISRRFSARLNFSFLSEAKVLNHLDDECEDFLPWLERKAGVHVSSKLYIGKSSYGRSLFASKDILTGDCILRVPYSVQIASDNLLPKVSALLDDQVGSVTKVAIVLLVEQKLGWESEWAHYLSCLPQLEEMNSTIFWSRIKSRAWGSTKGVSLIPFADFLNHDGVSEVIVLNDEDKLVSEVIADRNYAAHEEVLIRYGKFSNATLLLDFGFTLPYNIHDQVKIQIDIPHRDFLREMKLEILQKHYLPTIEDDNGFKSSWDSFIIKEVKSAEGKGKGLPQSLRAFARVLCCTSHQDLSDLVIEAAQNDGRLARRPFKSRSREIQAHEIMLSHLTQLIEEYDTSVKSLGHADSPTTCKRFALRRQMALDLLTGELRILKSASAWLKNYCASLLQHADMNDAASYDGSVQE
ncbi:uncharacterized protein LOC110651906 isoform X4 [Hevea brasiliensis]|uniref:uncharacterized protein LOC110651906 isoform X4 n=1 Tax=Hevea brasiliensis TaxID=3981 RepID=UPI0025CD132D|nr:uncharacterized protein LOC110651906 isoform X4 [Hevea brasiliensis]